MTIRDYYVTMKSVGIAELKAKLSEHLRLVRRGVSVTVLDRKHPVARIVPYDRDTEGLQIRRPPAESAKPCQVPLPAPTDITVDIVQLLLDDRGSGR